MNNLLDEVISGFNVTSQRKRIWQKELDILKIYIDICEKNNLSYFAAGGTLIGAIRHNGFIPWDDDIDIMMPRHDYEKFLEIAPKYLDNKYFLQYYKTEKYYYNGHAQIRDNETTCFTKNSYYDILHDKNCGVFIDIFPYDEVSGENDKLVKKLIMYKKLFISEVAPDPNKIKRCLKKILYKIKIGNGKKCQKIIEDINRLPSETYKNQNKVALITFMPGYMKNVWNKEWFNEFEYHQFEDIQIRIPKAYDEVLKTEFNNYMEFPKNLGGSIHGECYFDLEKSYKEYKNISKEEFDKLFDNITY